MATINPHSITVAISPKKSIISEQNTVIDNYSIDSRSRLNNPRTLFFALHTKSGDGHRFIPSLVERGVRNFIVSELPGQICEGANYYLVDDVLASMQLLASCVRNDFKGKVIAITGSRGKTVLKEWLAMFLPSKTYTSPRSFNSQIGVALSLLGASLDADYWVIEAGISKEGEMARLQNMIRPDFAVLTELTDEHSDGFPNRERHRMEKELLLQGLPENAVVNGVENSLDLKQILAQTLTKLGYPLDASFLSGLTYPHTRISVVDGIENMTLLHDAFTNNLQSLIQALDFADRRRDTDRALTLILADESETIEADNLTQLKEIFDIDNIIVSSSAEGALELFRKSMIPGGLVLIKGSDISGFHRIVAEFELKQHETVMEINLDNLIHNFNFFRSKLPTETGVCVMLKADGYGCGSLELARTLQSQGAAAIAVAVVDEGVQLRRAGITLPVIVLNPRADNYSIMFSNRLEPEIYSFEILDEVISQARYNNVTNYPIHIKVDTGMHRLGFAKEDIPRVAEIIAAEPALKVASVFSHLATADMPQMDLYTDAQLALYHEMTSLLEHSLSYPIKRHVLNTAGILRRPEDAADMVRLGLGLYGLPVIGTDEELNNLRPVAAVRSTIIALANRKPGDAIGYGRCGILDKDAVIATVPVGYADGIDRRLGNGNAFFVVRGVECPTVGNICMDLCMIDVTEVEAVKVGDRVEIFGPEAPLVRLSDTLMTIPYEIQTSISPRVKRVYYRE